MEMSDGRGQRSMREGDILCMGILEAGGAQPSPPPLLPVGCRGSTEWCRHLDPGRGRSDGGWRSCTLGGGEALSMQEGKFLRMLVASSHALTD